MKNPKFKVGDSVRILDPVAVKILGFRRSAVVRPHERLRQYLVRPEGPGMWSWWIKEKDLELVEEAE